METITFLFFKTSGYAYYVFGEHGYKFILATRDLLLAPGRDLLDNYRKYSSVFLCRMFHKLEGL